MHSAFSRTLNDVKTKDGSLCRVLNGSQPFNVTPTSLLMGNNSSKSSWSTGSSKPGSVTHEGLENKPRKHTPSRCFQRPLSSDADGGRFIPNRQAMDINRAQFVLSQSSLMTDSITETQSVSVTSGPEASNSVSSSSVNRSTDDRILQYQLSRPTVPLREPTEVHPRVNPPKITRFIPTKPDKVLDAPEIINDYYLNILDWSADFNIAVALDRDVYLWNARSGSIKLLMSTGLEGEHITSVRWSTVDANIIAVGTSYGRVELWSASEGALMRTMVMSGDNGASRVPVLAWREHIISSGSRTGEIRQHDIRLPNHEVGFSSVHTQEVCGLEWSPDGRHLASGGNDNLVCVFSATDVCQMTGVQPVHTFADHTAAVKAVAWCPWKPSLLSTGGGTADHHLRFWNVGSGSSVRAVDVETQVSGLIWNQEYRELITGHGDGKLSIWKYPSISKVKDLSEHQDRVLSITSSPDHEMVASCSADETIRIWNCFKVDHAKKRQEEKDIQRAFSLPKTMR
uniref:CDC20/Fizzy WD40 domain-containing protein n=1 Tax=Schistocephalus solidus TaxID=70667 RepID=A0A0X3Q0A4_SCHSO